MHAIFSTRASGKLLLTAEYGVLDGALALALPVRYGQTLRVLSGTAPGLLYWRALDPDDTVWFEATFTLPDCTIQHTTDVNTANTLQQMLTYPQVQQSGVLQVPAGLEVQTRTDFPRHWGLGTSSTLIAALCRWAGADPYALLAATLGGSGYDLACAYAPGPILFRREGDRAVVEPVAYHPPFAAQLYFVFLGKKQNSRLGIERYRNAVADKPALIAELTQITQAILTAPDRSTFEHLIEAHENTISRALDLPRAQQLFFEDYAGQIKSLGAWGGDFVLATSALPAAATKAYFHQKGFDTVLTWREMTGDGGRETEDGKRETEDGRRQTGDGYPDT